MKEQTHTFLGVARRAVGASRAAKCLVLMLFVTPLAPSFAADCKPIFDNYFSQEDGATAGAMVSTNVSPLRFVSFAQGAVVRNVAPPLQAQSIQGTLVQVFSDRLWTSPAPPCDGGLCVAGRSHPFDPDASEPFGLSLSRNPRVTLPRTRGTDRVTIKMFGKNYTLSNLDCTNGHITGYANVANFGQTLVDIVLTNFSQPAPVK